MKYLDVVGVALALSIGVSLPSLAKSNEVELEIVAEFDLENPPGNVAVTPEGRIFMSLHQFYDRKYRVVEVLPDGVTLPYPNEHWARKPDSDGIGLNSVLGVRSDGNGVLWMLDNAAEGQGAKLVGWNTRRNELEKIIYIDSPFLPVNGFLNDFAIDLIHNAAYITDTTGIINARNQALLVVDLNTGQVRRVLEGHVSNLAEDVEIAPEGINLTIEGKPIRVGSDSITIDPDNEWVYYGALSGKKMYRVRTSDLLNDNLNDSELGALVELFSEKPVSDGLTSDSNGNIYVTDLNAKAIGVINSKGQYRIIAQDDKLLSWPDGFAFGPDNKIYVVVNQLHRSPVLKGDGPSVMPPFYLLRFDAIAPGGPGR